MNCDKELDVRGLNCPLPILRTKKSLVDMTTGQVLKIIATDPGSVIDFQVFADQTGNGCPPDGGADRRHTRGFHHVGFQAHWRWVRGRSLRARSLRDRGLVNGIG